MAIVFETPVTTSGEASSFTISYTIPAGSSKMLMVSLGVFPDSEQYASSVTFNGVALTQIFGVRCGLVVRSEMWYLISPPEGTYDITVTMSASAKVIVNAVSLTGVNQTTPFYFSTSTIGDNVSIIPFTIQQEAGNCILGSGFTHSQAYAYVIPGQTQLWNTTYNNEMHTQSVYAQSIDGQTISIGNFLNEASTWALLLFNIKAA